MNADISKMREFFFFNFYQSKDKLKRLEIEREIT